MHMGVLFSYINMHRGLLTEVYLGGGGGVMVHPPIVLPPPALGCVLQTSSTSLGPWSGIGIGLLWVMAGGCTPDIGTEVGAEGWFLLCLGE